MSDFILLEWNSQAFFKNLMAHFILNYFIGMVTETNQLVDSYISDMISSKMT